MQDAPEPGIIAVCLLILKELCFTLLNFMTGLKVADLTNVTVTATLTKSIFKIVFDKKRNCYCYFTTINKF